MNTSLDGCIIRFHPNREHLISEEQAYLVLPGSCRCNSSIERSTGRHSPMPSWITACVMVRGGPMRY
ncbi:hypothetical protein TNCV_3451711 [Trichonephila clavipes]|nr:hypothetical protein TNCV_3451711 [Trichonephila clavipes]